MYNLRLGIGLLLFCITGFTQTASKEKVSVEPAMPTIRIVTEDFPPFQYMSGGKIVGPMYDVMVDICITAKLRCNIVMQPWADTLADAESGKADVIFSVLDSPKRREKFDLADSIIASSYSAFVLSSNPWRYDNPTDFKDKTIGAYGPSGTSAAAEKVIKDVAGASLKIHVSMADSFQALNTGQLGVDGVVIANKNVGIFLLRNRGMVGPILAGDIEETVYTFGVSKNSKKPYLLSRMNSALRIIQTRGQIDLLLLDRGLMPAHLKK